MRELDAAGRWELRGTGTVPSLLQREILYGPGQRDAGRGIGVQRSQRVTPSAIMSLLLMVRKM